MSLSSDERIELSQLKLEEAGQAVTLALIRLGAALDRWLDHAFNPNQPRVPAGHPDGRQWTDGDVAGVIPVADNDRSGGDRYLNPHIMGNHVGKSDVELIARIKGSQFRLFGYSRGIDRNGSFASAESARNFINRTLEANPDMVARVARGVSKIEFLTHRFGYQTGREAYVDPPEINIIGIRRTFEVGVVIRHNPNSEFGYIIYNAFPRNYYPPIGR